MKKVLGVHGNPQMHWVGDGFAVHSLFGYEGLGRQASPFLLLDYAAPRSFEPADQPRGVGRHPHRGFETVTFVYDGEVTHRDSTGGGGTIGPGDVQWMTAGGGILHEEFHSPAFTERGGPMEMVQLWVNLPARHKMAAPGYQAITDAQIPSVALPEGAGRVRVVAGAYVDPAGSPPVHGPARTFTPIEAFDVRLAAGGRARFALPPGHTAMAIVLEGPVRVNTQAAVVAARMVLLERDGGEVELEAGAAGAKVLLLGGEPIDEPIVGYGPFVMNSRDEIVQAIDDFNGGRFGKLVPTAA